MYVSFHGVKRRIIIGVFVGICRKTLGFGRFSRQPTHPTALHQRRSPLRISFYVGSSHRTKSAKWAGGESIPRTRITLALLSRLFDWRDALIVVQPKTLIRWHRAGFRLFVALEIKTGAPSDSC
jgi:hypothetical protein